MPLGGCIPVGGIGGIPGGRVIIPLVGPSPIRKPWFIIGTLPDIGGGGPGLLTAVVGCNVGCGCEERI